MILSKAESEQTDVIDIQSPFDIPVLSPWDNELF